MVQLCFVFPSLYTFSLLLSCSTQYYFSMNTVIHVFFFFYSFNKQLPNVYSGSSSCMLRPNRIEDRYKPCSVKAQIHVVLYCRSHFAKGKQGVGLSAETSVINLFWPASHFLEPEFDINVVFSFFKALQGHTKLFCMWLLLVRPCFVCHLALPTLFRCSGYS